MVGLPPLPAGAKPRFFGTSGLTFAPDTRNWSGRGPRIRTKQRRLIVSKSPKGGVTRREVMKKSGQIAVASALAGVALPQVHAAENNTIQVVLVCCGGRGTGAAANA